MEGKQFGNPRFNRVMSKTAFSGAGVVTSPHWLATEAGRDVLAHGGNAIEAALAIGSTLSVVCPHMNGLGGDGFWLACDEQGRLIGFDGAGPAGGQYSADLYLSKGLGVIPPRGPLAANTVAGLVSVWSEAHQFGRSQWDGKFSWSELLEPAEHYASSGFPSSASQHRCLAEKSSEFEELDKLFETFASGSPLAGTAFRQPLLAATLAKLRDQGADGFYRGELADLIVAGLQNHGSLLQREDFANYKSRRVKPLTCPYQNGMLANMPPPTQGLASLMILGLIDRFDLASMDHLGAEYVHLVVEATKAAFSARDRYISDPDFVQIPTERLLSGGCLDNLAKCVSTEKAQPWGMGVGPGDTVWFGVMDGKGRAVSAIQSIYFEYGSGVMAGETGIVWQNRGCSFSLKAGEANFLEPGKRPFHTLNPAMYLRNGRPVLVYGTMGGDGQPQTQAALATRAINFQLPIGQVVAAPRWLLGRTWGDSSISLKLEKRFSQDVYDNLLAKGHVLEWVDEFSQLMGHAGAIRLSGSGTMEAAADPRCDGSAEGL